MNVRRILFSKYPIEVGIARRRVKNLDELDDYTRFEIADCFASVYYRENGKIFVDKVFFDIDHDKIPIAYNELLNLQTRLKPYGTVINVYTGKKGFHCYLLLKGEYYIMDEAKLMLESVYANFCADLLLTDPRVTSDTNRLCRIPNTTREQGICSLLPEELPNFWYDASSSVGRFNDYKYSENRKHTLNDLYGQMEDMTKHDSMSSGTIPNISINFSISKDEDDITTYLLKEILRPCVFKAIAHKEAGHEARTAAGIELMRAGLNPTTATELLQHLNWSDFDFKFTLYHLRKIRREDLKPYGCKKLMNFCIGKENCNYIKSIRGEKI